MELPPHDDMTTGLSELTRDSLHDRFPELGYLQRSRLVCVDPEGNHIRADGSVVSLARHYGGQTPTVFDVVIEVGNTQDPRSLGNKIWNWFRVTNEQNEHVGVGIIAQLNYGARYDGIERQGASLNN